MSSEFVFNKEYELSDLVDFVNEKIDSTKVTLDTYISTDNMIVDRGGVGAATKLPLASKYNAFNTTDTLFSNIRTYFRKVWFAEFEGGASPDVLIFRTKDPEILDPTYLYYLLSDIKFSDYTVLTSKGAKMPRGDKAAIMQYKVYLPEPHTQREIGGTLRTYDLKLKTNNQTNQTLEQIAQALFKSWFVDFDPVKAKIAVLEAGGTSTDAEFAAMEIIAAKSAEQLAELKQSKPDAYDQLARTAALFPSAMQEPGLGKIPEGWGTTDLASCTTELRRGISPKYTEEGGVLVLNQKCIRNHKVDFSLGRRNDSSKRKIDGREIEVGDVLVNSTGVGTLGRLSPIRFLNETTVVDSHVTVVRANTAMISKSFLAGLLLTKEAYIEASGAGSTGQTELRKQVLEDIRFTKPSDDIDKYFDVIASNLNSQIAALEKQSISLARTRDMLLPELLSGDKCLLKGVNA